MALFRSLPWKAASRGPAAACRFRNRCRFHIAATVRSTPTPRSLPHTPSPKFNGASPPPILRNRVGTAQEVKAVVSPRPQDSIILHRCIHPSSLVLFCAFGYTFQFLRCVSVRSWSWLSWFLTLTL